MSDEEEEANGVDPCQCIERDILAGAWFGEASLFDHELVRRTTVFARADSELAVLHSTDYRRIVSKYPQLLERHANLVSEIQAGRLKLNELAHAAPPARVPHVKRVWDYLKRRGSASDDVYEIGNFDGIGPSG